MSMKIVLEGKVYDNPVECYIGVAEGNVSVPEGFLETLESEMTDEEKKVLACSNHGYWMKYLGVEVGDTLTLEHYGKLSDFNPFTVTEESLTGNDGVSNPIWREALIMNGESVIREIIKPKPTLKSILEKHRFNGNDEEVKLFLNLAELEGLEWPIGKPTEALSWKPLPNNIMYDGTWGSGLLHSNEGLPMITLDEILELIEITPDIDFLVDEFRTYQGIRKIEDCNCEIEEKIAELEDKLLRVTDEIEGEIEELESKKLVKVFDLERYLNNSLYLNWTAPLQWQSMSHMVEVCDNKIKGSTFIWSNENDFSHVPRDMVREFVWDESLADEVTVFSKKKYDEWEKLNGWTTWAEDPLDWTNECDMREPDSFPYISGPKWEIKVPRVLVKS